MSKEYKIDGNHVLIDAWDCDCNILNDVKAIQDLMVYSCFINKAEIRGVNFTEFAPVGVSGVVILSESHATIHTYPEHCFASIDVYTCGDKADALKIALSIKEELKSKKINVLALKRGNVNGFDKE